MKRSLIDEGLSKLEYGIESDVPQNLVYKILVSDVAKLSTTWRSIKIADIIAAPKFKSLTRQPKGRRQLAVGAKTPTKLFYYPILSHLYESGGASLIAHVYDHVESNQIFTTEDIEVVGGAKQEPRWRVTLRWAKEELIQKGFIRRKSARGVWALTAAGMRWFEKNVKKG